MKTYPMNDDTNHFPTWSMTDQQKFFIYRDREEGYGPAHDVLISDEELSTQNCEWYDDLEKFMEYDGVCTWTDIGCGPGEPVNMGIGRTEDEARWHGLYRSIRLESWHGGDDFVPSIYQVKSSIIEAGCLDDKQQLNIHTIHEIESHIHLKWLGTPFNDDNGWWVAEVQPNKYKLYKDYGSAVQDLVSLNP